MQDVADKKKEINDDDLLALITDEVNQPATLWSLLDLQVSPACAMVRGVSFVYITACADSICIVVQLSQQAIAAMGTHHVQL